MLVVKDTSVKRVARDSQLHADNRECQPEPAHQLVLRGVRPITTTAATVTFWNLIRAFISEEPS